MNNEEINSLIGQLCAIYSTRNSLEYKRRSAKDRRNYYRAIKRKLDMAIYNKKLYKKWKSNKSLLNAKILENDAIYVMTKYDIARHTLKNKKAISLIFSKLKVRIIYSCGEVTEIKISDSMKQNVDSIINAHKDHELSAHRKYPVYSFNKKQMQEIAKEYEANLAIEKMLNEK